MERLQGWLEAIGFCAMMTKVKASDPQWKFWKFRFGEGFLISVVSGIIISFTILFFSDNFVSKNTITETQIKALTDSNNAVNSRVEELKTLIITNTTTTSININNLKGSIDNLDDKTDTLGNRVLRIENTIYGTEGWNGN